MLSLLVPEIPDPPPGSLSFHVSGLIRARNVQNAEKKDDEEKNGHADSEDGRQPGSLLSKESGCPRQFPGTSVRTVAR